MKHPSISVIMPVRNMAATICRSLDSLRSQTMQDWEVVICDDGSTDGTLAAVERWAAENGCNVRLCHTPAKGVSAARNEAIRHASAPLLFNLDADDTISENFLAEAVEAMTKGADLFCGQTHKYENGIPAPTSEVRWRGYAALLRHNRIPVAAAYRKDRTQEIGGFDETMWTYEDWEFWIRYLFQHDKVAVSKSAIFNYYRTTNGLYARTVKDDYILRQMIRERNQWIYNHAERFDEQRVITSAYEGEVLVILPYYAEGAQGRELECTLAGWQRYAQFRYKLVIVGDKPSFDIRRYRNVEWLPCERVAPIEGQYTPHIDITHKFLVARKAYPQFTGFIYTCDDIHPIGDFDMADVLTIKANQREIPHSYPEWNKWGRSMSRTYDALVSRGLPTICYVCHLPVFVEWDKWDAINREFDLEHNDYVFEEIYFNAFYPNRKPILLGLDTDNIRVRIESPKYDISRVRELMRKKIWLSYGTQAYNKDLENMLIKYFEI